MLRGLQQHVPDYLTKSSRGILNELREVPVKAPGSRKRIQEGISK